MRSALKFGLASLAATILLAGAVTAASATRLSIGSRSFRAVWTPLTFNGAEGVSAPVECNVTIEGTFHSNTIVKRERALLGYVTRAIVQRPCNGGEAWVHNGSENPLGRGVVASSLPWHVTYEGFTGTLPNIRTIRLLLRGIIFTINAAFGFCLAVYGNGSDNIIGEASVEGGVIRLLTPNTGVRVRRVSGGVLCPENGTFIGEAPVTQLGNTTPITIRLI